VSFGSDELTRKVIDHVLADGTAWMSGSRWRGRDILRVSVSNWATDDDDVKQSVQAVHRAVAAARATG
jgi:glutamate/tyrosine decarboxylase-like PLP-dependent enzyme